MRTLLTCAVILIACAARAAEKDYEIKLTRPPKVGTRYSLVAEGAMTRTVGVAQGEEQKQKRTKATGVIAEEFGVRLEGTCEVLEVNRDGEEAKVACTVKKCSLITEKGDSELIPGGRVVTATGGKQDTTFTVDHGELSPQAIEALDLILRMGEDDGYNDDRIYGTKERQAVGGSWSLDPQAASDEAKGDEVLFDAKDVTGALKLEKLETVDGVECARIAGKTEIKSFTTKAPEQMTFVRGSLKAKYAGLYPVDTAIGTLSESMSVTHTATYRRDADGLVIEDKLQRASEMKRQFLPAK